MRFVQQVDAPPTHTLFIVYSKMDDIKAKEASGEYVLVDNTSSRAKSDVWEKFGVIREDENNIFNGFAARKKCLKVLAFDSRKIGTLSLRKHVDSCRSTELRQLTDALPETQLSDHQNERTRRP